MELYRDIEHVVRQPNACLTVGSFDGLHLGHQYVVQKLVERATSEDSLSTLVTFEPHPKIVLGGGDDHDFRVLTTIEEKTDLLDSLGLGRLVVVPFTQDFAKTTAEQFIRDILFERVGLKEIIVGYDHAFGRDREGNIETFRRLGAQLSFAVTELEEIRSKGDQVSSTRIRHLLHEGRVDEVKRGLGRRYSMTGTVVKGVARGIVLGFPTANLDVGDDKKLLPANGVYAVLVDLNGREYGGMMNIGVRPTFGRSQITAEVHIFNFDRRIYNRTLKVQFVQKIRDEQRFAGASKLAAQLKLDKIRSDEILSNC